MTAFNLRDGVDVQDELQRSVLLERRKRIADTVMDQWRGIAHWNRLHPDEQPLDIDDEQGTLTKALAELGLDLDELKREAAR